MLDRMRLDVLPPVLLAVAVALLTMYATTQGGDNQVQTQPITCDAGGPTAVLRELPEASGLARAARHPQMFWSHNDSGAPEIFAIGSDGSVRGRVRVSGGAVDDWEAVATTACGKDACLLIGDIGDNDAVRPAIVIYSTAEPSLDEPTTSDARVIEATYPDGPQDAEAMFAAEGQVFIVTKGQGGPVRLYRLPTLEPGKHRLQLVSVLMQTPADKTYRITDAALSPDGRWVALRSNDMLLFYEKAALLSGTPGTPLSYDLRPLREPQGEAVAWADQQTLVLAGEGPQGGTFRRVTCSALASPSS
jgi:hypothetical protein